MCVCQDYVSNYPFFARWLDVSCMRQGGAQSCLQAHVSPGTGHAPDSERTAEQISKTTQALQSLQQSYFSESGAPRVSFGTAFASLRR